MQKTTKPPPAICVAAHHKSVRELMADNEFRALANQPGFLIELRLDFFNDLTDASLSRAMDQFAPNAVATFRHPAEGGMRKDVSDAERLHFLQLAVNRGASFVDIEARTPRDGFNKRAARLIVSHHEFSRPLSYDELRGIWLKQSSQGVADVIKVVSMPKSILDTVPVLRLLDELQNMPRASQVERISGAKVNLPTPLFLCMGEFGAWTRILAGRFGEPFTFARSENAPGTAPGQLTWREMDELYRFRAITETTPIYGVIGNPIAHSLSPLLHNTAFKEMQEDGVYVPFLVDCNPAEFVRAFGTILKGLSVTIPHKESALAACQHLDPSAKAIGAVNTLVRASESSAGLHPEWLGLNTDAPAAADALESALGSLSGKQILILGAGGAARAIAFGVKERGATVMLLNRTRERAQNLARDVGATVIADSDLAKVKIDAIVNATPVGMQPNVDASPLEESQIPPGVLVYDTVYNPQRTKLLELAEKRGCRTLEGVSMFIGQGVRQFERWTGKNAPREAMERAVLDELKKRRSQ
ncbi:MAG TPA: shikimate dehydrogenase [Planctomycetota bacterium]|nr:shikimate dehydrogenase [Planctomycetota bacterium]